MNAKKDESQRLLLDIAPVLVALDELLQTPDSFRTAIKTPAEAKLFLHILAGISLELLNEDERSGIQRPRWLDPNQMFFTDGMMQLCIDKARGPGAKAAFDSSGALEKSRTFVALLEAAFRQRPQSLRKRALGLTARSSRSSEPLGQVIADKTIEKVNALAERRARVFKADLHPAWGREQVALRRVNHSLPSVALDGDSINDDAMIVEALSDMYRAAPNAVEKWLKGAIKKEPALDYNYIFGKNGGGVNDPMAFMVGPPGPGREPWYRSDQLVCRAIDWRRMSFIYRYYEQEVLPSESGLATRDFARRPIAPGSNAVLFSADPDCAGVVLQRRPANFMGGQNRGRLSLFGGAYQARWQKSPHDSGSLLRTLVRELFEEAGIVVSPLKNQTYAFIEEIKPTSQVQFCALGPAVIHKDEAFLVALDSRNAEGGAELVNAVQLHDLLMHRSWELSCHAHLALLTWVASGMPGATREYAAEVISLLPSAWLDGIDYEMQAKVSKARRKPQEYTAICNAWTKPPAKVSTAPQI